METTINLKTEQDGKEIELKIDNSTDFKDFFLNIETNQGNKKKRGLHIQIDKREKVLEINGMKISGLMLQILKEFINQ